MRWPVAEMCVGSCSCDAFCGVTAFRMVVDCRRFAILFLALLSFPIWLSQSPRNGRTNPPWAPACSILSGSLVLPLRGIAWELGIVGGVVGPDGILQSCVILLLVVVSLCSVSGLHCDFARPCNPILVPFVLPPIVRPGFVRTCMDCRIGTGLPRYCNTILVPIILRPFVPIGLNRIVHGLKDPGRILPLLVRI